jgi:hypothetical protein
LKSGIAKKNPNFHNAPIKTALFFFDFKRCTVLYF